MLYVIAIDRWYYAEKNGQALWVESPTLAKVYDDLEVANGVRAHLVAWYPDHRVRVKEDPVSRALKILFAELYP